MPIETPQFFTVSEIARDLRVSRMTVHRLIESKELAAIKVGRQFRISQADYADFLSREAAS